MRNTTLKFCLATAISLTTSLASAAILYDAEAGTTPNDQGWFGANNPVFGSHVSHVVRDGVLILDSSEVSSDQAGYFSKIPAIAFAHPTAPVMNLNESPFFIEFSMRLAAGSDIPDTSPPYVGQRNRGGFAVIAISDDLTGIELQFQLDHVLALDNPDTAFPIGETVSFDTTQAIHDYRIVLDSSGYQLSVDGSSLLQGPLRNYSSIAPSPPFDFPYTTPSFLFFGDDTARAGATTELTRFAVSRLGDCSLDGTLNIPDLSCITSAAERDVVLAALATLPGDLDGNGEIEFLDFLVLSANFGKEVASYTEGNIDLVDDVGFPDFLILSANFGMKKNEMVAVPEIHGFQISWFACALATMWWRFRRA